jgi:NhaA family Na+:H+ antiporter
VPTNEIHDLRGVVNNGLMSIFFLGVGLEVGREYGSGPLESIRRAILPVAAALGGMVGAAVVYVAVTTATGGPIDGWGVPMATDVAFTLGAIAVLGARVPPPLRIFVLTLAVADDVASVVVLSFQSSSDVNRTALALAIFVIAATLLLRRVTGRSLWPYSVVLIIEWWLFARAGIEPALAGVLVGVLAPVGNRAAPSQRAAPSERMEVWAVPLSTYIVLPLFALANMGVSLAPPILPTHDARSVAVGIVAARIVGKAGGIALASWVVVRLGGRLPSGIGWRQLSGAALLCGIGVTVPLLFASSAFRGRPLLLDAARVSLLGASVLAVSMGWLVFARWRRRSRQPAPG